MKEFAIFTDAETRVEFALKKSDIRIVDSVSPVRSTLVYVTWEDGEGEPLRRVDVVGGLRDVVEKLEAK